jgi:hypothetical protein
MSTYTDYMLHQIGATSSGPARGWTLRDQVHIHWPLLIYPHMTAVQEHLDLDNKQHLASSSSRDIIPKEC